jgi:hypothetical protein
MPRRAASICCRCPECITRNPQGLWFSHSAYSGHLARLNAMQATSSLIEDNAPHFELQSFALAMTDCGPDLDRSSRLWNSRADAQERTGSSDPTHVDPLSPPVTNLLSTVERIIDDASPLPQAPCPPAPPTAFSDPPISPAPARIAPTTSVRNYRTKKAIKVLENIESRMQRLHARILRSSSHTDLRSCSKENRRLHRLVKKVTRKADVVREMKSRLVQELSALEKMCVARSDPLDDDNEPIEFNTGEKFVSRCIILVLIDLQSTNLTHRSITPVNLSKYHFFLP